MLADASTPARILIQRELRIHHRMFHYARMGRIDRALALRGDLVTLSAYRSAVAFAEHDRYRQEAA